MLYKEKSGNPGLGQQKRGRLVSFVHLCAVRLTWSDFTIIKLSAPLEIS
jgi:hypothetical protein